MTTIPGDKAVLSRELFAIRGIAIALVVAGHVIGFNRENGMRNLYASDLGLIGQICDLIYSFHMPVFFICSGIAFTAFSNKQTDFKTFIASKFLKLLIPLLIWSPLYFIFQHLAKHQPFTARDVLFAAIFPYEIFWFIHALLLCTLLSYVSFKYLKSKALYAALSLVLVAFYLHFRLDNWGILASFTLWNVFYACGVLVADTLPRLRTRLDQAPVGVLLVSEAALLGVLIFLQFYALDVAVDYKRFISGPTGFFMLYVGLFAAARIVPKASAAVADFIVQLGISSMAIYLFHSYFTRGSAIVIQKAFGIPHPAVYLFVVFGLGVLGPWLLDKVLRERSRWYVFSIGGVPAKNPDRRSLAAK